MRDGVLAAEDRWVVGGFKGYDGFRRGAEAGLRDGGVVVEEWLDLGHQVGKVGIGDAVRAKGFDRELVGRCGCWLLVRKRSGEAVNGDAERWEKIEADEALHVER